MITRMLWVLGTAAAGLLSTGCALQEVRGHNSFGPEFRHLGNDSTDETRWSVEQGIQLRWANDVTTGVTYRRRDVDDGSGNDENRILVDVSYPLWKAENKKEIALLRRIEALENRLAALEAQANPGVSP